ncbi:Uncharacterized protein Rs2_18089 [Raphanus sativus]|nr:Uncharacterized protein Rs2_18089 [Raphanus sativus]
MNLHELRPLHLLRWDKVLFAKLHAVVVLLAVVPPPWVFFIFVAILSKPCLETPAALLHHGSSCLAVQLSVVLLELARRSELAVEQSIESSNGDFFSGNTSAKLHFRVGG